MGAQYVYGYMRAADAPAAAGEGVGEPPGPVERIVEGDLAALVTPVGEGGIAPRRANLLAHADVLRRALDSGTVLPMRFGMVVADGDTVRAELAARGGELGEALAGLDGRVEMNVSALYREDVLLNEVLAENPALVSAGRGIQGRPEAATHFERIRLGEQVAQAVEAKRAGDAAAIVRALGDHALAVHESDPAHERMVVNAAFLVERAAADAFDAAVESVSRERAERMRFKLLGPLPAHSFVAAWA